MISIATTCFNRRAQFINTLKSIQRSEIKDFEVIAVDDASDEDQRIDDLMISFPFLKVFRVESHDKKYTNPSIPFNLAFSHCRGDIIVIQNAECFHFTDILKAAADNVNENNYLSFACYSIDEEKTKEIENLLENDSFEFLNVRQDENGKNGWYNHGIYRPTGLHFCSAITKNNLKELNGFDERYAQGNSYDDNEFLHRIKNMGLKVDFVNEEVVIHQYHQNFNYNRDKAQELESKNAKLFRDVTLNEKTYKANPEKNIIRPKLIAFAQLRNELSKGNLENWFRQLQFCDYIYIYDQNSDDGSKEYYKRFKNTVVIESPANRFNEEVICKQELLDRILSEHKDVNWIFWLDGDSLFDNRLIKNNLEELRKLISLADKYQVDAFFLEHYNLWRSDIYYRVDDSYHSLSGNVCSIWRNNGKLRFNTVSGLHHRQYPDGIEKGMKIPFSIVHRGFATDYQIITKYQVYKSNGQSGWALERLLNEKGLEVEHLNTEMLPEWFEMKDCENPKDKKPLIEIYSETN